MVTTLSGLPVNAALHSLSARARSPFSKYIPARLLRMMAASGLVCSVQEYRVISSRHMRLRRTTLETDSTAITAAAATKSLRGHATGEALLRSHRPTAYHAASQQKPTDGKYK